MGVPGAQGGGEVPIVYLLRDEFLTDEAAPLTSPRAAEPGPGMLTLVQTDGQFSISAGKLVFPAQSTPAWGDQGILAPAQARKSGRAMIARIVLETTAGQFVLSWNYEAIPFYGRIDGRGLSFTPSFNTIMANETGGGGVPIGTYDATSEYWIALVLRTAGIHQFIKGGAYTDWTLLWVEYTGTRDTLYPTISNYAAEGSLSLLAVRDLPAPFDADDGIASVNEATVVPGTSYTATADAIHDLEVTAPNPLSGSAALKYRVTDADNYWTAYLNDAGAFRADSVAAGTPTNRVNVASVAVAAEVRTIRVITTGTKHNYYTLAGTNWTKRGGEIKLSHQDTATAIVPEATDYTLDALRSYPTTSPAYAELDRT